MEWIVYCIQARSGKYSYIGITNNFTRRHRQHNGEIKGGAKYTKRYRPWKPAFFVRGLTSHKEVLQLEWAIKHRRARCPGGGVRGRIKTLENLLKMERWTKRAPAIKTLSLIIDVQMSKARYLRMLGLKKLPDHSKAGKTIEYRFIKTKKKTKK